VEKTLVTQAHKRPTGESGPICITHVHGEPVVTWEKIQFSEKKPEQEAIIAAAFVKVLNSREGTAWALEQLEENDFDFLLKQVGAAPRILELQEIVIPPPKRGAPYTSTDQVIQSGKFADTIASGILRKAAKYGRPNPERPLELLIYNTHWRFLPNRAVLQLVAHDLKLRPHPFAQVHCLSMHNQRDATLETLFPTATLLNSFDHAKARATRYANLDPARSHPIKNADGSIGVGMDLGPDAVKKLFGVP
jgi:hypothetical protein